jgi:aconitate hydratase
MLRGRHIHPEVEVGVAPGSRQVVLMLAKDGLLTDFVSAGVRILENACGFCIGNNMAPATNAVSLRTNNRNFEGRSGTQSAQVYLVSPETAVAAALRGVITDPRELGEFAKVDRPSSYIIDNSMLLYRETVGKGVSGAKIERGPNIGIVPSNKPLPEALNGIVSIKVGDKITTDHIMPAGPRLKFRSNVPQYANFVFERVDVEYPQRATANRDAGLHNVIIAGDSYGQGSSREHAALCPMYLGVKAVIAKSIERIHFANLVNFGIVPFVFQNPGDYDRLIMGDRLKINNLRQIVAGDGIAEVTDETENFKFTVKAVLTERQKKIILAGGLLATVTG